MANLRNRVSLLLYVFSISAFAWPAPVQSAGTKKVYMITDMEGVDGIFSIEDQCEPFKSPRWVESQKLLTDEANAAVEGLFSGGATDVVVADLHDTSRSLSVLTIDPRARLLQGKDLPPTIGIDSSYSAVIFIGQHAMAGAKNGVLSHTESWDGIQNVWVNNKLTGEIGSRVMLAGYYDVPVIMLAGDAAACEELQALVPKAECAAVKTGFSRTAGISLSHKAACDLIRQRARVAMEELAEFKPYKISGPVEVKVEYTPPGTPVFRPNSNNGVKSTRTHAKQGHVCATRRPDCRTLRFLIYCETQFRRCMHSSPLFPVRS